MGIDVTDEIRKDVNEMCNYGDYLYSKGEMKGEMEAYFNMVKKGFITTSDAAAELNMSEEEFIKNMKNAHEGVPVMA